MYILNLIFDSEVVPLSPKNRMDFHSDDEKYILSAAHPKTSTTDKLHNMHDQTSDRHFDVPPSFAYRPNILNYINIDVGGTELAQGQIVNVAAHYHLGLAVDVAAIALCHLASYNPKKFVAGTVRLCIVLPYNFFSGSYENDMRYIMKTNGLELAWESFFDEVCMGNGTKASISPETDESPSIFLHSPHDNPYHHSTWTRPKREGFVPFAHFTSDDVVEEMTYNSESSGKDGRFAINFPIQLQTGLLFKNSQVVLIGASNEHVARYGASLISLMLQKYLQIPAITTNLRIVNLVTTFSVGFRVNLAKFAEEEGCLVNYIPRRFPAIVMRSLSKKIAMLVNYTGNCILTGAKSRGRVRDFFKKAYKVIKRYKYDETIEKLRLSDLTFEDIKYIHRKKSPSESEIEKYFEDEKAKREELLLRRQENDKRRSGMSISALTELGFGEECESVSEVRKDIEWFGQIGSILSQSGLLDHTSHPPTPSSTKTTPFELNDLTDTKRAILSLSSGLGLHRSPGIEDTHTHADTVLQTPSRKTAEKKQGVESDSLARSSQLVALLSDAMFKRKQAEEKVRNEERQTLDMEKNVRQMSFAEKHFMLACDEVRTIVSELEDLITIEGACGPSVVLCGVGTSNFQVPASYSDLSKKRTRDPKDLCTEKPEPFLASAMKRMKTTNVNMLPGEARKTPASSCVHDPK